MAYSQRWGERRWPEVPQDRDDQPPRPGRRRFDEPDELDDIDEAIYADRPIVNPYSIVALVAALLLLFPVAIVFGLIAFTHPRGRLMAFCAFVLGMLETALLVALILLPHDRVSEVFSQVGDAVGAVAGSETAAGDPSAPVTPGAVQSAAVSIPAPSTGPASPQPTAPGTTPQLAAPAAAAELDRPCPEPALVGAAAAGDTLVCLADTASVTGYRWAGPHRIAGDIGEEGDTCVAGGGATARTPAGYALVCEGGVWVLWTS
ncbi:hypothetical protein [Nocardia sp. NPDC019395]|uniref:hypothetical protein n=1 Tax=Nocardia sp. NPDC019395 TaxID=3154686 RepID=UPI0033FF9FD7